MVDQSKLITIIATAIRDAPLDYPVIRPGVTAESVLFAKVVLKALDRAGLRIVPKSERTKADKPSPAGN